jgi:hypothetical protein
LVAVRPQGSDPAGEIDHQCFPTLTTRSFFSVAYEYTGIVHEQGKILRYTRARITPADIFMGAEISLSTNI